MVAAAGARLGGAGLAGDRNREGAEDGGGCARVGSRVEAIADRADVVEPHVPARRVAELPDDLAARIEHGLAHVRPDDCAAVRERRVRDRELQRGDRELALADSQVDRVALVPDPRPALLEGPLQPGRGGDETRRLAWDVEPGWLAGAEPVGPILHIEVALFLLVVEQRAEPVEPGVARDRERLRQRQARVDARLDVVEDVIAHGVGTRALERGVRSDQPGREASLGDDRLEG